MGGGLEEEGGRMGGGLGEEGGRMGGRLGEEGGREVGEMIPICYVTDNGGQVLHGLLLQY